ncbi:MAG: PQQ-binding-like beta-propeller repeat protein, partial [Planctomycetes bacterium]|nr:PQQ-binding-like beta-propeller repeat protein [Planctomycetota bacterium]
QAETFKGKNGGLLWAIDTTDGSRLAEYELSSMPVWDGMAVARGRLFMARSDGTVVCMGR